MSNLKDKRLFLLDMDGTIYLDDDVFDGTMDFLAFVKKIGGRYLFLTNNSSKSAKAYVEKMTRLGIESTTEDFLTSVDATILYLQANHPGQLVYASGTATFCQQLEEASAHLEGRSSWRLPGAPHQKQPRSPGVFQRSHPASQT